MSSTVTPPPVPVKQKSIAVSDNVNRINDSPTSTPPRVPGRRPSLAQMPPVDMTNGKRNSTFSEEEDVLGPPVPIRTASVNKGIISRSTESEDSNSSIATPDSPKPPPIPKKKTPLKVSVWSVCVSVIH